MKNVLNKKERKEIKEVVIGETLNTQESKDIDDLIRMFGYMRNHSWIDDIKKMEEILSKYSPFIIGELLKATYEKWSEVERK